jgi:8-oxo-dGTP pyrophosphatase MutT (NUDIX family)
VLRVGMTVLHGLMKASWFVRRPRTFGAHAVALTHERRLILVKLRYAPGWRLPGGGRSQSEHPIDAALRELREEIGMTGHGDVALAFEREEPTDFKRDLASLVIVRDVEYRPSKWSLEVEEVCEAALDDLPSDLSPRIARWLDLVSDKVQAAP